MDTNNRDRMYGQPQNGMVQGQGQIGWNQNQFGQGSQYGQSSQGYGTQYGQSHGGQNSQGQNYGGQSSQGYGNQENIGSSQMYGGSSQGNLSSGYQNYSGPQGNLSSGQGYQSHGGYGQQGFGQTGQGYGEGGQHQGRFDSAQRSGAQSFDGAQRGGQSFDSTQRGGQSFDSTQRGGQSFDSAQRSGAQSFDSAQRGGAQSFDSTQRGGAPFIDQDRQGQFGRSEQRFQGQGQRSHWQREPLMSREVMTQNVKTVTKQTPLKDVAKLMKDENVGIIPVVDEQHKLLGVVTDRDIVTRLLSQGKDLGTAKAEDVMTDDVEAVTPDESIHEVLSVMADKQVRRVPVVDKNDKLLGIISLADLASRADYDEELQHTLAKISAKRSFWSRLFG